MENRTDGGTRTIYLAGGCFWGMEKLMQSVAGVLNTTVGYANGSGEAEANYPTVCTGKTGFRETVRVEYDSSEVSLDRLLFLYFAVIDPTLKNRQGHDVGTQYQAGIYYADEQTRSDVLRVAEVEKRRTPKFAVEILPLTCFYAAEEYHQRYLDKNPGGYCHIPPASIRRLAASKVDAGDYRRPEEAALKAKLTDEQYRVTQLGATERPFENPYWNRDERGIYVDVVTGEPLFSSLDKFESACGWPAFSAPLEPGVVVERDDASHGMLRTEVRSRAGDSHLGHVFTGEEGTPGGVRYCINSAALRFVPYEEMEKQGYGSLKKLFEKDSEA